MTSEHEWLTLLVPDGKRAREPRTKSGKYRYDLGGVECRFFSQEVALGASLLRNSPSGAGGLGASRSTWVHTTYRAQLMVHYPLILGGGWGTTTRYGWCHLQVKAATGVISPWLVIMRRVLQSSLLFTITSLEMPTSNAGDHESPSVRCPCALVHFAPLHVLFRETPA